MRPAPEGYEWLRSVSDAIGYIEYIETLRKNSIEHDFGWSPEEDIELIDIDHDAGEYAWDGGDYIKLLDWLEETGRNYPIRIHSMNVVGRMNMEVICRRNGWTVVK